MALDAIRCFFNSYRDLQFAPTVLANGTRRSTHANQLGLLGFGGDKIVIIN